MDYTSVFYMNSKFSSNELNAAHGERFVLTLDLETMKELGHFDDGLALNIFGDGSVMLTGNVYDRYSESYNEYVVENYTGEKKKEMIEKIDAMLEESPLAQGEIPVITTYQHAVAYLKS